MSAPALHARPLRREEAKQLTRYRLLQACRALLTEQGPEQLTTGSVTRRAGVAQATFYVHFRDMNALLSAVATEIVAQVQAALSGLRLRLRDEGDFAATVRRTYGLSLDAIHEHAGLLKLFMAEYPRADAVLGACARRLLDGLSTQLYADLRPLPLTAGLDDAALRLGADTLVALTLHTGLALAEGRHRDRELVLDMLFALTQALLGLPRRSAPEGR